MVNKQALVNQTCCVCDKPAERYCTFCEEEYDDGKVPSTFYCIEHYRSVVQTGNCCYGSELAYGSS